MKILLMQPRYTFPRDVPLIVEMPLGLCYLAAVLREKGYEVHIIDCLAEGYLNKAQESDFITYGISDQEIINRIKNINPDVIGCSSLFTIQHHNVRKLCELIKKVGKNIITVVGGMHATIKPWDVLSDENVDFIIQGEADYTFLELVEAMDKRKDYREIDGIGYKEDGAIHIKEKKHFIKDLDKLPFPARDLLDIKKYFEAGLAHGFVLKNKKNMNLITSRGCPAHCVFCTIHLMWGREFRSRSPENVLLELKHLKNKYGVKHVQFEDDNLTCDIPRAKRIFQGMIDMKLNLKWTTPNGVALWRMDEETLLLMKKAGCYYVKFAVESGSQRVLSEVINKPQSLEKIVPLIKYSRKIGLKVGSFFVVGLPGETKEEMDKSFGFPYKVKLDWVEYSLATPHYGTKLREICEAKGYLVEHKEEDLYARKGLIKTSEFNPYWLEKKVVEENKRYIKHLLLHQPLTILMQGWEVFKRNPSFVIEYAKHLFGFSGSKKNRDNEK